MNQLTRDYLTTVQNSGQASRFKRDKVADERVQQGRTFSTLQSRPQEVTEGLLGAALGVYHAT